MRKILVISITLFVLVLLPKIAHAQGRWVYYQDSNSGATLKCYMPYEGALCTDQAVIQGPQDRGGYRSQQLRTRPAQVRVIVVQQPQERRVYRSSYPNHRIYRQVYDEPYEEQQEQEVTETTYGGGIDRWSRRPYGHYEIRNRKYRARVSGSGRRGSVLIQTPYFYWSNGYYR